MKTLLAIIFSVVGNAYSLSISWNEDSPTSFDVVIAGIGGSYQDTIVSPSGLWQLESHHRFSDLGDRIEIGQDARIFFLPALDSLPRPETRSAMFFGPWDDVFSTNLPIITGSTWNYPGQIFIDAGWYPGERNLLELVSIAPFSWIAEYRGHGTSLASRAVPDNGGTLAMLGLAVIGLSVFGRQQRTQHE